MNGAITKEDMIKYESIRRSGKFNMITESRIVCKILWPEKSDKEAFELYSFIFQPDNYRNLMDKYFLTEDYNYPKFEYNETITYDFK